VAGVRGHQRIAARYRAPCWPAHPVAAQAIPAASRCRYLKPSAAAWTASTQADAPPTCPPATSSTSAPRTGSTRFKVAHPSGATGCTSPGKGRRSSPLLAVRGRLAVSSAAATADRGHAWCWYGPRRIEVGLSGKRDRARRQSCRERRGLPESAGQCRLRMTQRHQQARVSGALTDRGGGVIPRGCLLAVARRGPVLVCVGGGGWFGRAGGWREGSPR
jgi:hypothetical protein